jgi:hypothetical protein
MRQNLAKGSSIDLGKRIDRVGHVVDVLLQTVDDRHGGWGLCHTFLDQPIHHTALLRAKIHADQVDGVT